MTVSFSSAGSADPEGAPLSYLWGFGDGTTSTVANPSHTYTHRGQRDIYADGVVTNLDDLLPSGLHLASATGINNAGQIVGVAIDSRGDQRAFLLSPAP